MDVLNQKQFLESTNCVVEFFSIFFEIFRNFRKTDLNFSNFSKKYFSKNGQRLYLTLLCDNLKKSMFLQNFFPGTILGICYVFPVIHIISLFYSQGLGQKKS
jgi:hypothetical protein